MTFVKRYGIEVGNDVVIETNPLGRLVGGDYLMPVVMTYERHAITRELGNMMTMFPVVRSVQVAKDLPTGDHRPGARHDQHRKLGRNGSQSPARRSSGV